MTRRENKSITTARYRNTAKSDQILLAQRALEKLQDTANNPKSANRL
jgi:hypothetical protein